MPSYALLCCVIYVYIFKNMFIITFTYGSIADALLTVSHTSCRSVCAAEQTTLTEAV